MMQHPQPTSATNPAQSTSRPRYEEYGISIEERGDTTHIFKDGKHVGSFTIDLSQKTLRFHFPDNQVFNYFAYVASDIVSNRVRWVNESLRSESMDAVQAGVAFLGFAKFEELMAHELEGRLSDATH